MGNAIDTLVLKGGQLNYDTITARGDFPWRVESTMRIDTFSVLNVEPGGYLIFQPGAGIAFSNQGNLDARGTADSLITLTSLDRPTVLDPNPQRWGGLTFHASTFPDTSWISNAVLEYGGGYDVISTHGDHALHMDSVHVRNSASVNLSAPAEIRHVALDSVGSSTRPALRLYSDAENDTLRVSNTIIRNSPDVGLFTDYSYSNENLYRRIEVGYTEITGSGGIGWDYHGGVRDNNNIYDNVGDGVVITLDNPSSSTGTVTWSSPVWWGDADGPHGPNGDGISITNSGWTVDVTDWLASPVTITGNPWLSP